MKSLPTCLIAAVVFFFNVYQELKLSYDSRIFLYPCE